MQDASAPGAAEITWHLLSPSNANQSQWVEDEISLALDKKIKIIPFRVEDVSPEGALRVLKVRSHWIDAHHPPWQTELDKLVRAVRTNLGIGDERYPENMEIESKPKDIETKKKIKKINETPGNLRAVEAKAQRVYKNDRGFREADYGDDLVMVYIPPGPFTMGATDGHNNEKPPHEVDLDGYWIGKYEVTFAQYDRYCRETKKEKPSDKGWGRGKRPVINVSREDAAAYCVWLAGKTGLTFKLPTEAQWEKAARGTDVRQYPWGNEEPNDNLANYGRNIGKTSPVGSYLQGASPYGLLDMGGNVWEWCLDWYDDDYYNHSPQKNPAGPQSGSYRVLRGGSWNDFTQFLRCANRDVVRPSYRINDVGFRLCQDN